MSTLRLMLFFIYAGSFKLLESLLRYFLACGIFKVMSAVKLTSGSNDSFIFASILCYWAWWLLIGPTIAMEYDLPTKIRLTCLSLSWQRGKGTFLVALSPNPSSAFLFSPQIQTMPLLSRAIQWVFEVVNVTTCWGMEFSRVDEVRLWFDKFN